jgi:DNA-binding NarL/FixJ family response regulator
LTRPRVLLAEDHPSNSALLRDLLQTEFEVVAAVHNGQALLTAASALSPDVIVTDIGMPGCDGIVATRTILRTHPAMRIVFVTVHDEADYIERGLEAGALGYVLKHAAGDELLPAVHAALRGERHVCGTKSERVETSQETRPWR